MIPSRLFSIKTQGELNAIYIISLLKYFDKKCDLQILVYAFFLLKNGDFSYFTEEDKSLDDFITSTVKNSKSYPLISRPFQNGVEFLKQHNMIAAKKIKNKLFYFISNETISKIAIPDKVDIKAKKIVNQINEHGRDNIKILFREQENLL